MEKIISGQLPLERKEVEKLHSGKGGARLWRENGGGVYTSTEKLYARVYFLDATVANVDGSRMYTIRVDDGETSQGLPSGTLGARTMGAQSNHKAKMRE